MNVLTVWQPFAWAIAEGLKPLENRSWHPFSLSPGQRLAIHAAKRKPKQIEIDYVSEVLTEIGHSARIPDEWDLGAVVAVATFQGSKKTFSVNDSMYPWWVPGQIGWILKDISALDFPIPCRGYQGLWKLPRAVERSVETQIR